MVAKFLDLNNLPWQRRPEETYGVLFCSWVQSCTGKSYMSSIFVFFFLPYLQGYVCCWDPEILLPPNNPTTHTLHAAVWIPVHARSDIKVHILQNVPFAFAVVQKMRDLLILTDILLIANVFFRLQWYFCLFLGCFWESSSTVCLRITCKIYV